MMLRHAWISMLTILLFTPVFAQENTQGWDVTARCAGDLPQHSLSYDEWTFDGVIFSEDDEGVHTLRSDIETPYFVAFDNAENFGIVGGFSPDGRWFAYPTGDTSFDVNGLGDESFSIDTIRVVGTALQSTTYQIPWTYNKMGSTASLALPHIQWLDNERFIYESLFDDESGVVNAFTGELEAWDNETPFYTLSGFSPNYTRAFHFDRYGENVLRLYDIENDNLLTPFPSSHAPFEWLSDASGFVMGIETDAEANLVAATLFSSDGQPLDTIYTAQYFSSSAFSADNQRFAFTAEGLLYIADMGNRTITDLCFQLSYGRELAWSPDGVWLAFTYDWHPVLLNTETLDLQILDYRTNEILGWYPLES